MCSHYNKPPELDARATFLNKDAILTLVFAAMATDNPARGPPRGGQRAHVRAPAACAHSSTHALHSRNSAAESRHTYAFSAYHTVWHHINPAR